MRIKFRDGRGDTALGLQVDTDSKPSVVRRPDLSPDKQEIFLDWDRALDDEGHLRHCLVCGCPDLYTNREVPRVTLFVLVVLAAVLSMFMFGVGEWIWGAAVLVAVVLLDLGIMLFARKRLVCYNCFAVFADMPIRKTRRGWQQSIAEKYKSRPGKNR